MPQGEAEFMCEKQWPHGMLINLYFFFHTWSICISLSLTFWASATTKQQHNSWAVCTILLYLNTCKSNKIIMDHNIMLVSSLPNSDTQLVKWSVFREETILNMQRTEELLNNLKETYWLRTIMEWLPIRRSQCNVRDQDQICKSITQWALNRSIFSLHESSRAIRSWISQLRSALASQ